jgi:hypothetical protein
MTSYNQQYILISTNKHVNLNLQLIHNQALGEKITPGNFTNVISSMIHKKMT